ALPVNRDPAATEPCALLQLPMRENGSLSFLPSQPLRPLFRAMFHQRDPGPEPRQWSARAVKWNVVAWLPRTASITESADFARRVLLLLLRTERIAISCRPRACRKRGLTPWPSERRDPKRQGESMPEPRGLDPFFDTLWEVSALAPEFLNARRQPCTSH